MAHVDASLVQQIFDIPKRERESDVQHHGQADDLGTGFKVLKRGRSGHGQKLRNRPAPLKQCSSDKTFSVSLTPIFGINERAHAKELTDSFSPQISNSVDKKSDAGVHDLAFCLVG